MNSSPRPHQLHPQVKEDLSYTINLNCECSSPGLLRLISEGHTSEETDSDPEEDPLPEGWEEGTDSNGRHFFRNHLTRTITLRRPGPLRPPVDGRSYLPRMDSTDVSLQPTSVLFLNDQGTFHVGQKCL